MKMAAKCRIQVQFNIVHNEGVHWLLHITSDLYMYYVLDYIYLSYI